MILSQLGVGELGTSSNDYFNMMCSYEELHVPQKPFKAGMPLTHIAE